MELGEEMLDKELNIVRLVRNLRTTKLLLKAKGIWTEVSKAYAEEVVRS